MAEWLQLILSTFLSTLRDVLPIVGVLAFFQLVVLRKKIPNLQRVLVGSAYVIIGLALFLVGLEQALFPLGKEMARLLTDPGFLGVDPTAEHPDWRNYFWTFLFAASIGFATTIAEPSLIAVAIKTQEVSGGAVGAWGLRIAVAVGVALSLAVGVFRIVTGTPLYVYMIAGYLLVIVQTMLAPRLIIPVAYDSGGVTTSTVTVPLVAALGVGLAQTIPGRSALDGFGLIALASLFPIITVMAYAQASQWRSARALARKDSGEQSEEKEQP